MNNIILIAPPAAGKGTQSKLICEKFNLCHISVGDILRLEIKKNNRNSEYLKKQIDSGNLVNDQLIIELIESRLNEEDCKNGFVLDGFPRNLKQAIMLDNMNKKINYVFYLQVNETILKKRIEGRISCPKCGNVYNNNIEDSKPLKDNICDKCNTSLIKRTDDNVNTFEKRYETYVKETQPIIDFYRNKNILYEIKSLKKDEVFNEIVKVLNGDI